jgi:hypothetical protein
VQVASATAPASLHTIDRTTGQATLVAALPPHSDGEALVVAADQALYRATGRGAPNVDEVFERIDPASGARTTLPLSGDDFDGAAAFGAYTGSYLLVVDHAQQLHCVTTTGRVRHFGGLDHTPTGLVFAPASNEAPFFRQYGDGCALANGDFPLLMGCGNPMGGHNPGVHLRYAVPGAIGVLAAGGDDGVVAFPSAACPMQVVPLFFTMLFTADALGDFNTWFALPVGTAPTDVFFQIGLLDGTDLRVTNGVQMHVR